jgi:hypothetical protein
MYWFGAKPAVTVPITCTCPNDILLRAAVLVEFAVVGDKLNAPVYVIDGVYPKLELFPVPTLNDNADE